MIQTRKPSLDEAMDWVKKIKTDEYRVICFSNWRKLGWSDLVTQVEKRLAS
jgi:hypothetical protein